MSDPRPELSADIRKLPREERMRRAKDILDRIEREGPSQAMRGKTVEEVVQMVKKTREEMAKERLSTRP